MTPLDRGDAPSTAKATSPWPSCSIPPLLPARGFEATATAELRARYEDIAQDGRVQLTTLMPGLGAVWRALGSSEKIDAFRAQGILPILRRIVIAGEDGPFSVHAPLHFSGTWRLAREDGGDRIFLDMWLEAFAPIGSTLGPPPPRDAERVLVGRAYAEHVVTRPFAPPAERKVTRLDLPGIPSVPEDLHSFEDAEDLSAGHALEPAGEHVFGMMHTDSNQHVNSLVYPRLFEEAVVRTIASRSDIPDPSRQLTRAVELRYRKPFFTGDRAGLALRVEPAPASAQRRVVAVGAFSPAGGAAAPKPSCTVAAWLG
ncbi:MAG: hypothetical protein K0S65_1853 [Labilithrix sp.]|nr:hypothetical protein [Labilithrix sp.]